jgi:hypothetical protein
MDSEFERLAFGRQPLVYNDFRMFVITDLYPVECSFAAPFGDSTG